MEEQLKSNKAVVMVSHSLSLVERQCGRTFWRENAEKHKLYPLEEMRPEYQQYLQQPNSKS